MGSLESRAQSHHPHPWSHPPMPSTMMGEHDLDLTQGHLDRVVRYVRQYLPPHFDHEDLAVGILIESYLNHHPLPSREFIRHRCWNVARQRRLEIEAMSDTARHTHTRLPLDQDQPQISEHKNQVDTLTRVLDGLERRIIAHRFFMNQTWEDVAHSMDMPLVNVKSICERALYKMREAAR